MWFWVISFYILLVLVVFNSKKVVDFVNFVRRIGFSKKIPGPGFTELLANAKSGRILTWLKECQLKYGTLFRVWLGPDLFLFISDLDDAKAILSNNQILYKSRNYKLVEPWLGKGLLTNGGESWHRRRKLLTPAFHFKILGQFKQPMEENCDILINQLKEVANGEIFDIYPYITLFALDVICETAMGIKKHAQINKDSEYVQAVQSICKISHEQSFTWWARSPLLFSMSKLGKNKAKAIKILHKETKRVIEMRRKILETEGINKLNDAEKESDIGSKRRLAFLDMLLITQKEVGGLSDTNIREEVDTFMFEGHDTTSSALSFTLYLLSKHKEVQDKAYEEAKLLEGQEHEQMKYLEAVIKESQRLYPAVAFYSRILVEDLQLRDYLVPCGTSIATFAYMIHRNPQVYPNPEKFDPERFLNNGTNVHPYAFVAFSAGPRNCIGQKFAMLELKSTIAKLLRKFEFLPAKDFEVHPVAELVLKSKNGFKMRLKLRES